MLTEGKDQQQRHGNDPVGYGRNAQRAKAPGNFAAEQIADHHSQPRQHHNQHHPAFGKAGDVDHKGLNIAEPGKHTRIAKHGGGKNQPRRRGGQKTELLAQPGAGAIIEGGHPAENSHQHGDVKHGDKGKGIAPAEVMPKPGAAGDPHQVSHRHPADHPRHRGGHLPRRRDFRQDNRADAKERPVRKTGNQAAKRQHGVATGEGKQGIAENTQGSEKQHHRFQRKPAGEQRHDRRADHHTEGIPGNHIAGGGDRNPDIVRHIRQHAHNAKFRHAESEGAQRQ